MGEEEAYFKGSEKTISSEKELKFTKRISELEKEVR